MIQRLTLLICLLLSIQSLAQQPDSLSNYFNSLPADTASVRELSRQFSKMIRNNAQLAERYGAEQLALSQKLGYKPGIAEGHMNIGEARYRRSEFPAALDHLLKGLKAFEQLGDLRGQNDCADMIAKVHRKDGNLSKAIEYARLAIRLGEKTGDKRELVTSYIGLGNIYGELKQYDKAIASYKKSLHLCDQLKRNDPKLVLYSNIAEGYKHLGDLDLALKYQFKALKIIPENPGKDDAIVRKQRGVAYLVLADIYLRKKENTKALRYAKLALEYISEEYVDSRQEAYDLLAKIHKESANFEAAYDELQRSTRLKDSIFNETKSGQMAEMQVKYETEKKENENLRLQRKTERQKVELQRESERRNSLLIIGIVLIILIISCALFVINRRKMRQKMELSEALAQEEKLRFKSVIDAEEKERSRIAQELHDGLGQLLSAARLNVAGLEDSISEEDKPYLERSLKIMDDACVEVRHISHNMMPSALIRLGLVPAIQEVVSNVNNSGALKIELSTNAEGSFGTSVDISVYRIVQEVLNNMIRHAQASLIHLDILHENGELIIRMKDNGIGFDTERIKDSKGLGWRSIFSRVSLMEGTIELDSKPHEGTIVFIRLKLKNA